MLQEDAGISYTEHKTNKCPWKQVNILTEHQELLLSSVKLAYYLGSAMSDATTRYQKSYYMEQQMVFVVEEDRINHGGTTSQNGQATHCRRCCTSQMTEFDGRP